MPKSGRPSKKAGDKKKNEAGAPAPASSSYTIFKGKDVVPMTGIRGAGDILDRYPFAQLQPGESFFIPETDDNAQPGRISYAISQYKKKVAKHEFGQREYIMDGPNGTKIKGRMVWRIK